MVHQTLREISAALGAPVAGRLRSPAVRPLLVALPAALMLYAVGVMLAFANSRSVWLDEAMSVAIASQPIVAIVRLAAHVDAVHAFYYVLLHFWLYVGRSAVAIRMLSVVCSLGAMFAVASLAKSLFGRAAAIGAIAILGTSGLYLFSADEARPSGLALLASSLAARYAWRFVRTESARDAAGCGCFAAAAIYADAVAAAFVFALGCSLAVVRPSRRVRIAAALTAAAVAVAVLPLAWLVDRDTLAQVHWIARSGPAQLLDFAVSLLAGSAAAGRAGHLATLGAAGLVAALAATGVAAARRTSAHRERALAVTLWLIVPLALGIAVDQRVQPILVPRYFSFALIPLALLGGYGLATVARRARLIVAAVLVLTLASVGFENLRSVQREDWRDVARDVALDARPGDGVVLWAPIVIAPYEFALHEAHRRPPAPVIYPDRLELDDREYSVPPAGFTRRLVRRYRRVWFIDSHDLTPPGERDPFAGLARVYARRTEHFYPGVRVVIYSR